MYDTILVAVDGSAGSERAAREARGIAEMYDADVHLLSVVDVRSGGSSSLAGGMAIPELEEALEERAETALENAEELFPAGVSVTTTVRHGVPGPDITAYAEEEGMDFVVVGTQGLTGIDRVMLGSVAEHVLRRSAVPVLTIRESVPETDGYERILVPTDGSPHAELASDHAIDLADRYGATIHLVSVLDLQAEGGLFDAGGLSDEFVERHERAAREVTERIAQRAEDAGVAVDTAVVQGVTQEEIPASVDANDVDLVAMGTHGRSGVRRVLLGSVTESVVRNADCPVLSVRRQEE